MATREEHYKAAEELLADVDRQVTESTRLDPYDPEWLSLQVRMAQVHATLATAETDKGT